MAIDVRKLVREILNESLGQLSEIDWEGDFSDVKKTCMPLDVVVDYLNRVRANASVDYGEREKFSKSEPYFHAKSDVFRKEDVEVDIDYFIKTITQKPKSIIGSNEKIQKTGGQHEYVYNTGIPALRGLVYDIANDKFYKIVTCPGATKGCINHCYAMSGNYIRYSAAYDSMTRRLNFLLNDPIGYEQQMYEEFVEKCKEHNAFEGYKSKVIVRWNDSGDFFSNRYVKIAENVINRLKSDGYNVDSYAYTKVADVTKNQEFGSATFSADASPSQVKKMSGGEKTAIVVPKTIFKDLNLMKLSDEKELKKRIAKIYKLNPDKLLTYDELMSTPKGDKPEWSVIVSPGDGDDAAFRKDVKTIFLTEH